MDATPRRASVLPEPDAPFRCERPSKSVFALLADGRLVPMRCGASNRCAYCAWLVAVENSLVVGMDAQIEAPTVGMTLTTHRADFDLERFRVATANVFRWLRRDLGFEGVEYCGLMEWNGRGNPHLHALVKGLPAEGLGPMVRDPKAKRQAFEREVELREKWRGWTGGAWVVDMRPLRSAGGAVAYMVGHHHKREQAPPEGVRGVKRMRPSRGYFSMVQADAQRRVHGVELSAIEAWRERARRLVREKMAERAVLAKLIDAGVPGDVMDDVLHDLVDDELRGPPAVPVKRLPDGRLQHLSTGEVFDGPGDVIHAAATRGA
jgi:hypothetical protein